MTETTNFPVGPARRDLDLVMVLCSRHEKDGTHDGLEEIVEHLMGVRPAVYATRIRIAVRGIVDPRKHWCNRGFIAGISCQNTDLFCACTGVTRCCVVIRMSDGYHVRFDSVLRQGVS